LAPVLGALTPGPGKLHAKGNIEGISALRKRITIFLAIIQTLLFATHWFVYRTWADFWAPADPRVNSGMAWAIGVLSVSFVTASLLAWRYNNVLLRVIYRIAAVWLGLLSFLFFAACACWAIYGASRIFRWHMDGRILAGISFGAALAAGTYGVVNAAWLRVKRVRVRLPNLPELWRGRKAALVSDTHLGHVRGLGFVRRIVRRLNRIKPDVVFLAGDFYDGTAVNAVELANPLGGVAAPQGTYFVTGNHEEFRDTIKYVEAMKNAGVRVLENEMVTVDGLQIAGVFDRDSARESRLREILRGMKLDRGRASILMAHEPRHLDVPASEGISLQVSGHTHGGQFVPWTRFASRIFGPFVHGLQRFAEMAVFTSYGAGTWGPPMRVGTYPEIVLIEFE
jgi:uncharacterized protein